MKKFMVIYHAPDEAVAQMSHATTEQIIEATKPWMAWKAANEENIIDFGSRLIPGESRSANVEWQSSSTGATGFSIVQGSSLEEVKELLNNHPQLAWDPKCSVSVYEFNPM